jgi:hypothetical protein
MAHTRRDPARPRARLGPAAVPTSLYPERSVAALAMRSPTCSCTTAPGRRTTAMASDPQPSRRHPRPRVPLISPHP